MPNESVISSGVFRFQLYAPDTGFAGIEKPWGAEGERRRCDHLHVFVVGPECGSVQSEPMLQQLGLHAHFVRIGLLRVMLRWFGRVDRRAGRDGYRHGNRQTGGPATALVALSIRGVGQNIVSNLIFETRSHRGIAELAFVAAQREEQLRRKVESYRVGQNAVSADIRGWLIFATAIPSHRSGFEPAPAGCTDGISAFGIQT
jgi:hypothetical protein